jgi:hypothetical protein
MAKKLVKKKTKAAPAKKAASGKKVAKGPAAKKAAKKALPPKKAAAPVKKKAPKRTKEVRLKAFWGVFNQSLRRIALFEFNERKQADKKAAELTKSGKSPHFVQPVKEVIEG